MAFSKHSPTSSRGLLALLVFSLLLAPIFLAGCPQIGSPPPAPSAPVVNNTAAQNPFEPSVRVKPTNATPFNPAPESNNSFSNVSNTSADAKAQEEAYKARQAELERQQQLEIERQKQAELQKVSLTFGTASSDPNRGKIRSKICAISVDPARIYVGQETSVHIYANSANNERVSYLCGDDERIQGQGGIFTDTRICTFNTPGRIRVWIAMDGQVCASAPLDVMDAQDISTPAPFCQVLATSRNSRLAETTRIWEGILEYRNMNASASLAWRCPYRNFTKILSSASTDNTATQSGWLRLACEYGFDPGSVDSVPVSIGAVSCGDLVLEQ